MHAETPREPWTRRHVLALGVGVVAAAALRLALLPTEGLRGDIDQFVVWVNHIAVNGLPRAYDEDLAFGPVMAYIWGLLGAVEPGFRTATDASDPWLRALMKVPASLADFGLAAGVAFGLRSRPTWALIGALAILFHPAVWYVSAWWGQYESIFVLAALVATLFAINGRNSLAAAALAVAVLTKPQAVPLVLPFLAWFFARGGLGGLLRAGLAGGAVAFVLWLPFLAAGGPLRYITGVGAYQDDVFSVLSLRAWNVWWLVQEVGAGGGFVSDRVGLIGPVTLRVIGYAVTGLLGAFVAFRIWRSAEPRAFVLGLAAMTLVTFSFLTTMHERYAYGAVVFLMLLVPDRRLRWVAAAFGVFFVLNLVAAVPPTDDVAALLPVSGWLGIAGSIALTALTVVTLIELAVDRRKKERLPAG
jgi:hypothetical protein